MYNHKKIQTKKKVKLKKRFSINYLIEQIYQRGMSIKIFIYLGKFLIILAFLSSIYYKLHHNQEISLLYQKNYTYIQASLRNYSILLPRTSEMTYNINIFLYIIVAFEALIVLMILLGKSLAGYMLILYYGIEVAIDYLMYQVGRQKGTDNIFVRWQLARYVALFGIAVLFTYNIAKPKRPFEN